MKEHYCGNDISLVRISRRNLIKATAAGAVGLLAGCRPDRLLAATATSEPTLAPTDIPTASLAPASLAANQLLREEAMERVTQYALLGLCCSEAVVRAMLELYIEEPSRDALRVASGFCGGVGASHEDICGALTGGVIAASCMFGREEPSGYAQEAKLLAALFRIRFLEEFGSTGCADLIEGTCPGRISSTAVGLFVGVLTEREHDAIWSPD